MKLPFFYKLALKSVIFSAFLGIVLTTLYLITKDDSFLGIGFIHLIPTIPYHLIVFLILIFRVIASKENRIKGIQIAFIMLLNIPLALLCATIVLN